MSIYIAFSINQKQITLQGDADLLPAFLLSLHVPRELERLSNETRKLALTTASDAPAQVARQRATRPRKSRVKPTPRGAARG